MTLLCTLDEDLSVREIIDGVGKELTLATSHFSTVEAFLANCDRHAPGCLVSELRLPDGEGLQLLEEIRERKMSLAVVIFTAHATTRLAVSAMHRGAATVLEKSTNRGELRTAILSALDLSRERQKKMQQASDVRRRFDMLTPGERRVLDGLMVGRPNKDMASELGVAVRTIEARRHQIHQKTQTKSLAELLRIAFLLSQGQLDGNGEEKKPL